MSSLEPFYELIRRVHDHEATEEDYARLEKALLESPESRLIYLRYWNVDSALESIEFTDNAKSSADLPRPHRFAIVRPLLPVASLLVGILLTASLLPWFFVQATTPHYVATLIAGESCQWSGTSDLREGGRIAAGPLHLQSGKAVMRFDGGALMLLQGEAEVELRSRSQAVLHSGHLIVKAEDQAAGFLLDTPSSRVVDLGTEFAVNVDESGATEVHVLEGLISYTQPSRSSSVVATDEVLLAAGNAVRFGSRDKQAVQSIALQSTRFEDVCEGLYSQKPSH